MATQEYDRGLDLGVHRSKFIFCGECAKRRPYEELHPIGKAGGQHFEQRTFDLSEFDTVDVAPGFFGSLDFDAVEVEGDTGDSWSYENLHPIRAGILYAVVRHAPRINHVTFEAEIAERQPQKDPNKSDEITKEQLGFRRSTESQSHLALVRLDDDEVSSFLTCWKCDTQMAIGRGELVRAVEHALEFGGDILVSRYRIVVRNPQVPFETKTNRRKWRATPPVSFRRGTDFVASGHVPE